MLFAVVSGVGRRMDVLDESGDCRRGRGNFGGKCRTSHFNHWRLYYYCYFIHLTVLFQDNPDKLTPKKQNHFGKTNLDLLEQEIVAVTSAGRYANLHLAPDR